MSLLECAAALVSALSVWLTARRQLAAWPLTLVASALYALVFSLARLYSDTLLQGVYALSAIYGWWSWRRGQTPAGEIAVRRVPPGELALGLLGGTAASLLLGFLMRRYTDAALPFLDAALTGFSLVAQLWAARRYLANWPLWLVLDTTYTGLFLYKQLYLTAALYAFFLVLAAMGWRSWRCALPATAVLS